MNLDDGPPFLNPDVKKDLPDNRVSPHEEDNY